MLLVKHAPFEWLSQDFRSVIRYAVFIKRQHIDKTGLAQKRDNDQGVVESPVSRSVSQAVTLSNILQIVLWITVVYGIKVLCGLQIV